jgi:hypothetical protein
MDMYSLARDWEISTMSGYSEEAFEKFSEKVNVAIRADSELKESFQKLCSQCVPVIQSTLDDDKQFLNYLKKIPESWAPDLSVILSSHLHDSIKKKGVAVSLVSDLWKKIEKEIETIRSQVIEQATYFRDVAGMGLYYDGDEENSPYDLLADIRAIDEIFFREAPEFGNYKNTSSEEASQLITGEKWASTWGDGSILNPSPALPATNIDGIGGTWNNVGWLWGAWSLGIGGISTSLNINSDPQSIKTDAKKILENLSEKINALIQSDSWLKKSFQELCSECTLVIQASINEDKRLLDYLNNSTDSATRELSRILTDHLDESFKRKGVPANVIWTLAQKVEKKIISKIRSRELQKSSKSDKNNYDNNLVSAIQSALSGANGGGGRGGGIGGGGQWLFRGLSNSDSAAMGKWTESCQSGFCVTVETLQNSDYFVWSGSASSQPSNGWGKSVASNKPSQNNPLALEKTQLPEGTKNGRNSFQGIFEEWLDWIIKRWDNRNLSCKTSTTTQLWQNEPTRSLKFKNQNSGSVIFPSLTPPPLIEKYFDRKKNEDEEKKAEQRVIDSLKRSFRRYDMDFERPTNINSTQWQAISTRAINRADDAVPILYTLSSFLYSKNDHEQVRKASWLLQKEKPFVTATSVESIKHMEITFDDTAGRMRMLHELVKTLKVIIDYISEKDDCPWS